MPQSLHPFRSVLYMPASNARALDKARRLDADALIFDLEDAVAPAEKARARELVLRTVAEGGYGSRRLVLRVNPLDSAWGGEDLRAACAAEIDAILLAKVERPEDVAAAAVTLAERGASPQMRIWAMIETPQAVLNAAAIARAHPRLECFVLGTNDLADALGAAQAPDRQPLLPSLGLCLLAARAAGILCLDGVYNAFRDEAGLGAECVQGRALGFDGKTLIHPAQIPIANRVFAPSPEEIAQARAWVEAFRAAEARGEGVAVVEGRLVENLHAANAERLLARAAAIEALQAT